MLGEKKRSREESFRRLQCEQSTAGRIRRLMRLDQKRVWSNNSRSGEDD